MTLNKVIGERSYRVHILCALGWCDCVNAGVGHRGWYAREELRLGRVQNMLRIAQDVLEQALVMQLADSSNIKSRASAQAPSVGSITNRLQFIRLFICNGAPTWRRCVQQPRDESGSTDGFHLGALEAMVHELAQSIQRLTSWAHGLGNMSSEA